MVRSDEELENRRAGADSSSSRKRRGRRGCAAVRGGAGCENQGCESGHPEGIVSNFRAQEIELCLGGVSSIIMTRNGRNGRG